MQSNRHHWRYGFWGAINITSDCSVRHENIFSDPKFEKEIAAVYGTAEYHTGRSEFYRLFTPIVTLQLKSEGLRQSLSAFIQNNLSLTTSAEPTKKIDSAWFFRLLHLPYFVFIGLLAICWPLTARSKIISILAAAWLAFAAFLSVAFSRLT
ncbi:MAG: hypothetical protein JSR44_11900 [Spirochaetes bacterium]|nr:hypothetical protein [Spirochaetota bacterium]